MYPHSHHRGNRRRQKGQGVENLFQEMTRKKFPHLAKHIDLQAQKVRRVALTVNPERPTPGYVIVKTPRRKDKENLRSSKRKAVS